MRPWERETLGTQCLEEAMKVALGSDWRGVCVVVAGISDAGDR